MACNPRTRAPPHVDLRVSRRPAKTASTYGRTIRYRTSLASAAQSVVVGAAILRQRSVVASPKSGRRKLG
eukprot:9371659-Alexandrium_andersonii.AAC.1